MNPVTGPEHGGTVVNHMNVPTSHHFLRPFRVIQGAIFSMDFLHPNNDPDFGYCWALYNISDKECHATVSNHGLYLHLCQCVDFLSLESPVGS